MMKRVRNGILLAFILSLLIAIPVFAQSYTASVTVTESSSNAYTQLPITASINNTFLVGSGYISSSGLDTRMLKASTVLPHMLASDRTLFSSNVGADEQSVLAYTFGNTSLDAFYTIVGYDGYITVSDHSDLELGDDFTLEVAGYIDTSSGSDKNLIKKEDAFAVYISDDEEITAAIPDSCSEFSSTSDGCIYANNAVYATAQAAATGTVADGASTFDIGQTLDGTYQVDRGYLFFDTSAIPDGAAISSAILYLRIQDDVSDANFDLTICDGMPTYPTDPLAVGDFDKTHYTSGGGIVNTSEIAYSSYPAIESRQTGTTAFGTSHSVALPGSIVAGELLLVIFTGSKQCTFSDGSGLWTELDEESTADHASCVYYKVATGGDALTITSTVSVVGATVAFRISDYSGTPTLSKAEATSADANPPNHNPGINKPYLWIAAVCIDTIVASAAPANYSDFQTISNTCSTSTAERELTAAQEDPGVFTSASDQWIAYTISIPVAYAYISIELSETGLGWVVDDGTTKLCIRSSEDIAASVPAGDEYVTVFATEEAGSSSDPYLEVTYLAGISVTGVTNGLRTVIVYADGADLTLEVYDEEDSLIGSDTAALSGASVPDNNGDWTIMQNNCMPYMEYLKINVGVTGQLWYQPTSIILGKNYSTGTATFTTDSTAVIGVGTTWTSAMVGSMIESDTDNVWHVVSSVTDTTNLVLTANYSSTGGSGHNYTMMPRLPDRQGTAQDGQITWGSNPAGVSVSIGGLESVGAAAAVTPGEPTTPEYVTETPAEDLFTESTGENIPIFYPIFKMVSDVTGWPIQIFWITGALALSMLFGGVAMIYLRSMLIAGITSITFVIVFCSMGIIPWWILYVYIIMAITFVVYQRVVSV